MFKKFIGTTIPYLFFHLVCCSALLFVLISSGYLLLLVNEGRNKTWLIPVLILGGLFYWLHHYLGKCCQQKGHKTWADHTLSIVLYLAFSVIFGLAFMIYVFLPWWIPNYRGGPLLP